jgi:hypothetical protein
MLNTAATKVAASGKTIIPITRGAYGAS